MGKKFKTLSFGELLWDVFPGYKTPGGSPANIAYHLHILGNESHLLTRVGSDRAGEELIRFIETKGLRT
ncbi:MAG: carbohydrate kinase, partial [Balneolaceae bacterium]